MVLVLNFEFSRTSFIYVQFSECPHLPPPKKLLCESSTASFDTYFITSLFQRNFIDFLIKFLHKKDNLNSNLTKID